MINDLPLSKDTRTTWKTSAREIAEALGVPITPFQWVELIPVNDEKPPWSGRLHVVVWERQDVVADDVA